MSVSLRDQMAMAALTGMIAEPRVIGASSVARSVLDNVGEKTYNEAENYAIAAYAIADAMMARRGKKRKVSNEP